MPQIFPKSTNLLSKLSLILATLGFLAILLFALAYPESPYSTQVGSVLSQPVAFSHKHHVKGLGLDCRYCHASVENSASAGIPTTEVCMTCHSQIWPQAPELAGLRDSLQNNQGLEWNRVHDLPDYVYFNHSIHISKGVSCVRCHGSVENMSRSYKAESQTMRWCLKCHAHQTAPDERVRLRNCYTCHR